MEILPTSKNPEEQFPATCAEPMIRYLFVEYPARKSASVQVTIMLLTDLHHQVGPLFSSALWRKPAQGLDTVCLRGRLLGMG